MGTVRQGSSLLQGHTYTTTLMDWEQDTEVAVSEKKPGSLDTLSKEELVQKCKSLLQLAHKAKNAKDDKQKQYDAIQAESEKEKEELQNRISLLESKNEDVEDLLKSKQRKIDRLSDENDSFLGQV